MLERINQSSLAQGEEQAILYMKLGNFDESFRICIDIYRYDPQITNKMENLAKQGTRWHSENKKSKRQIYFSLYQ